MQHPDKFHKPFSAGEQFDQSLCAHFTVCPVHQAKEFLQFISCQEHLQRAFPAKVQHDVFQVYIFRGTVVMAYTV